MMKIHSHIFAGILLALGFSVCGHNGSDLLFDKKKTTGAEENTGGDSVSVSTIPANGATSVLTSTTVTVTFSTAMNTATITTNTADTVCSGSLQVSSDNFTTCVRMNSPMSSSGGDTIFTMTPMTALTGNPTNYKIRVTTAAQSASGAALSSTFVNSFTTKDMVNPSVLSTTPANGASGIGPNTTITVTFSEAMDVATLTTTTNATCSGSLWISSDNFATCIAMTSATPSASGGNTLFTVQPASPLAASTYKVKVTMTAADPAANTINPDYISATGFTTVATDSTPPTVSSTSPANSATNISASTSIAVTFSEAMNATTITADTTTTCSGTIQVSKASDDFASGTCIPMTSATPAATGGNTVFTVTPAANLAGNTVYKIRVTTSVQDVANISMASQFNTTPGFTTAAAPIYFYSTTNPTSGLLNGTGGRAGADAMCVTSAVSYSFPTICSTKIAIISIASGDGIADMAMPAGRPIQGPTGIAFVANWASFKSPGPASLNAAITAGIFSGSVNWWSFSNAGGVAQPSQSCTGGTTASSAASDKGRYGNSAQSGDAFFFDGQQTCNNQAYLLCACYTP